MRAPLLQRPPRRLGVGGRSADRGFTLIELLIAIVLSGVIAGVTVAALATSMNIAKSTTDEVNDSTDAGLISAFLYRDAQSSGGVDPATALMDTTLGVSTDNPDGGVGCVAQSSVKVRFSWVDPTIGSAPATVVVTYALDATTRQLTRRICTSGTSVDAVLARHLGSAVASCSGPTQLITPCPGRPTYVSLTITGSGIQGPLTLTASLRGGTPATLQSSSSSVVSLMALRTSAPCPNLALTGTELVTVIGDVLVDGTCGPNAITDAGDKLRPTGTRNSIGGITDPFVGHHAPTFDCAASSANPVIGKNPGLNPDAVIVYPLPVAITKSAAFDPGHYVFCSGLDIQSGTVTGAGVLFYVHGGTLAVAAGATVDLTASPAGPDAKLLIWVATSPTVAIVGGPRVSNFRGLIYAPKSTVTLTSALAVNIGGLIVKDLAIVGPGAARVGLPLPARTISPASIPAAEADIAYAAALTSSDGQSLSAWSAQGLPPGLVVDPTTGAISGTPTVPGSYPIIVTAFDDTAAAVSVDYTITVFDKLIISGPPLLPTGQVGIAYPPTIVTSLGGTGTKTWSATGLPAGLSINAVSGEISGTPTSQGSSQPKVYVTDGFPATVFADFTITVNPALSITASLLHDGVAGSAYVPAPTTSAGGTSPYLWSATGLPPGLLIDALTGVVSGTPTAPGAFNPTITVHDAIGATASHAYPVTIAPPSISLAVAGPATLPAAQVGSVYPPTTVSAIGGVPPYGWSATGLPPGLVIDAVYGIISGTPLTAGSYNAVVKVTDASPASAQFAYTVTIVPPGCLATTIGWRGEYYANATLSGTSTLCRDDPNINFDWLSGSPAVGLPADNFSVRWTRTQDFTAGDYTFVIGTDDGARLYIDGVNVFDRWVAQSYPTPQPTVDTSLTEGPHTVVLLYYERTGLARATLAWHPALPPSCTVVPANWFGEYYSNNSLSGTQTLCRDDASIDFDWGSGVPAAGVPADDFSVRWTKTQAFVAGDYTFAIGSDEGARLYIDGKVVFDKWVDQLYPTLPPTVNVSLTGGNHTIVLQYYERAGVARATLTWKQTVPASCLVAASNWSGEYFSNNSLTGMPALCRDDATIDFDWGVGPPMAGVPADDFSVRWTKAQAFTAGDHTFAIGTDDGARLYIDDLLVFNRWQPQSYPTPQPTVTVPLTAGNHKVVLEYYERGGYARATLTWTNTVPILCAATASNWLGQYFSNNSLTGTPTLCRDDASINFDWGTGGPAAGVPADNFSVRWTKTQAFTAGEYTFAVGTDDGARLYIDGLLVFNRWQPQSYPTPQPTVKASLAAGSHTIVLEYYEQFVDARATLTWTNTGPVIANGVVATTTSQRGGQRDGKNVISLTNSSVISALTVTINVAQTAGVTYGNQWTDFWTNPDAVASAHNTSGGVIRYTFNLNPGQTIVARAWSINAQWLESGTIHPTAGDTWTVVSTSAGVTRALTGTFS